VGFLEARRQFGELFSSLGLWLPRRRGKTILASQMIDFEEKLEQIYSHEYSQW